MDTKNPFNPDDVPYAVWEQAFEAGYDAGWKALQRVLIAGFTDFNETLKRIGGKPKKRGKGCRS